MKYGIVISVSKTEFGPIVFRENLKENIKKAAAMGYDGIELAVRDPQAIEVGSALRLLERYHMEVVSVGTGQIYGEEGLSFSDPEHKIRDSAVERTKNIINIARQFDASVIIGLVRGNSKSSKDTKEAEGFICDCLRKIMAYSESWSQKFLLEPINRYETNIFNCLDEVNSFFERNNKDLDLERTGILADTFHMNIEEPAVENSFKKYFTLIKHIHFADSNRWPPGYGHIDFGKIMKVLKDNNYGGYISFEMLPKPDPDTAARAAIENIKKLQYD